MVTYAAALALSLPSDKQAVLPPAARVFPAAHSTRLEKMAEFVQHITKPSGLVPQIGDNDSGRFLKLLPVYETMTVDEARGRYANLSSYQAPPGEQIYWDEVMLDHRHLVSAINGLFGRDDLAAFASTPETAFIQRMAGGHRLPLYHSASDQTAADTVRIGSVWAEQYAMLKVWPQRQSWEIPIPGDELWTGLQTVAYPDFGLFIFRSRHVYLAVRCGPIGQCGHGGHAHNDQLAVELTVDGEDWIADPGTYLYTPLPARRNEYRSVRAHFAPQLSTAEPGRLDLGLFRLGSEAQAECLYFGSEGFIGLHWGYGTPLYRAVTLNAGGVLIEDCGADRSLTYGILRWPTPGAPAFSPKYGGRWR
jgi:hypothetical protein